MLGLTIKGIWGKHDPGIREEIENLAGHVRRPYEFRSIEAFVLPTALELVGANSFRRPDGNIAPDSVPKNTLQSFEGKDAS